MPPAAFVISTYLHWPTCMFDRLRGVSICTNFAASGPDFHLTFHCYIAQNGIIHQVPEILFGITKITWDVWL